QGFFGGSKPSPPAPRGGGATTGLQKMHMHARAREIPLTAAVLDLLAQGEIKGRAKEQLTALMQTLAATREMLGREGHVVAIDHLLEESGYVDMWKADKSPDAPGRLENLKELVRSLADYETLSGFLEHVALVMDTEDRSGQDSMSIMTLHGAKGLEFDTVFLPGWEEGVFPSQRTLDEGGLKGLEEERRLAYVGITRARRRAIISHAANRRIYGNWQSAIPSRFVEELPAEHIESTGDTANSRRSFLGRPAVFGSSPFPLVASRRVHDITPKPAATSGMKVGVRVFHQKFGYGTITSVEGNRLEVAFEKAGPKRVIDTFVEQV
ncbi:MAG: 3'-5' exonuclease, partial [Komagataeibacter saccharivorans]|uniref:ATP-dependent helicase n=1 Tax=Komagataeibacter saccharivorans TaxID=265959 RepID=UPI0039E91865